VIKSPAAGGREPWLPGLGVCGEGPDWGAAGGRGQK